MKPNSHTRRGLAAAGIAASALIAAQIAAIPAHAATFSRGKKPAPTATPTPTATATPAPSSSLSPGAAPTSVPASTTRRLLGTVTTTNNGTVTVTITAAGRYTLEYDTASAGGAFNNVVDGTFLQQTYLGASATGYSQTFFLSAGRHSITLGGPEVDAPAQEYLDGTL